METDWNDAYHPRFDKWVAGLNSSIFRNATPEEKDQFLRTAIGYFGLTVSQVNNLVRIRWQRKDEDHPHIREDAYLSRSPRTSTSPSPKLSCINESDPFNMEDFSDMDPKFIITIGRECFHLPSIYNWVINLKNKSNPLTNIAFTDAEIQQIESTAMARFPLQVTMKWINRKNVEFQTTSLDSVANFAMKLYSNDSDIREPIRSMYRLITKIGLMSSEAVLRIGTESKALPKLLADNETTLLLDLGVDEALTVYMMTVMNPHHIIIISRQYRTLLQNHDWPTDVMDERIRKIENFLGRNL